MSAESTETVVNDPICLGCGAAVGDDNLCECTVPPSDAPVLRADSNEARALRCSHCGGQVAPDRNTCTHCQSHVMTTRCGVCLAWNLAESKHCHLYASSLVQRQAQPTSLRCPRCRNRLAVNQYRDTTVDECDTCGGLFLTPELLDRLPSFEASAGLVLTLPVRARFAEREIRYVPCPRCEALMNRQVYGKQSGVVVDVCKSHGVWFDAGELNAVVEFVRTGGLARMRQRELEVIALERRRLRDQMLQYQTTSLGEERSRLDTLSASDVAAGIQLALRAVSIFSG